MAAGGEKKPAFVALGIDLGTSSSIIAIYDSQINTNKPHVPVLDPTGQQLFLSSAVAFDRGRRIVGQRALRKRQGVQFVKRIMGCSFDDPAVREFAGGCEVVANKQTNHPMVRCPGATECGHASDLLTPEQLSAAILSHLKGVAEECMRNFNVDVGAQVLAVISVPANFNATQRQATFDAARIAGFERTELINEPTAAAFGYRLNYGTDGSNANTTILVFDLGGGTLDCTLMSVDGAFSNVLAIDGDTSLGGHDFDRALAELVRARLREQLASEFPDASADALAQACASPPGLLKACEQAKIELAAEDEPAKFFAESYLPKLFYGHIVYLRAKNTENTALRAMHLGFSCFLIYTSILLVLFAIPQDVFARRRRHQRPARRRFIARRARNRGDPRRI